MEKKSKRRKLNSEVSATNIKTGKLKSQNDLCARKFYDFNSLPYPILLRIFRYLPIIDRWIVGSVCKKWYKISRDPDPIFWKKLDVCIGWDYYNLKNPAGFIGMFPGSVFFLRILFETDVVDYLAESIHFIHFMTKLRERCPNLQALTLDYALFGDGGNSNVTYLSNILSRKLKVLKLQHVKVIGGQLQLNFHDSYISNIEVFDVSWSDIIINPLIFLQMPHLRELYLAGLDLKTDFFDSIHSVINSLEVLDLKDSFTGIDVFQVVVNYGLHLTHLYVCYTDLDDYDFRFLETATVLPRLKVLCIRGCRVSCRRINSLIKNKPSLIRIYVGDINNSHLYNSAFDYTLCTSEKIIICEENHICCDRTQCSSLNRL